jgi:hypothetical protein
VVFTKVGFHVTQIGPHFVLSGEQFGVSFGELVDGGSGGLDHSGGGRMIVPVVLVDSRLQPDRREPERTADDGDDDGGHAVNSVQRALIGPGHAVAATWPCCTIRAPGATACTHFNTSTSHWNDLT